MIAKRINNYLNNPSQHQTLGTKTGHGNYIWHNHLGLCVMGVHSMNYIKRNPDKFRILVQNTAARTLTFEII